MNVVIEVYDQILRPLLYVWFFFYLAPYLVRKAWGDAENRTKKVCDICFRDIKRWNEAVEKEKMEKIKKLMKINDRNKSKGDKNLL